MRTLRQASKAQGCQGAMSTSSKMWEDFNVHTVFNKALKVAFMNKYEEDSDEDAEDGLGTTNEIRIQQQNKSATILVVGNTDVGKTTLINRMI